MTLLLVEVDSGDVLDRIEVSDGDVAYETGVAGPQVQAHANRMGISEAAAVEALKGHTNGYIAFRRADPVKAFLAEMAAKHLPGQHNQESHGHHGTGDALSLAGRIHLNPGEELVSSGKFGDGEHVAAMARVDTPEGPRLRLGVVPSDVADRWRAGERGRTLDLTPAETSTLGKNLRQLSYDVNERLIELEDLAIEIEDFDGFDGDADLTPDRRAKLDRYQELSDSVQEGVLVTSKWGELHYRTESDGTGDGAQTLLAVKPRGVTENWSMDGFGRDAAMVFADGEEIDDLLREIRSIAGQDLKAAQGKHLPGLHDQRDHGRRGPRVPKLPDVSLDVPKPAGEPKPPKPRAPRRSRQSTAPREETPKPRRADLDRDIDEASKGMRNVDARARKPLAALESLEKRARTRGLRPADIDAQERAEEELRGLQVEGGFWANRQLELLAERDGVPWGGDASGMPTAKPRTSRVPNANHDEAARASGEYVVNDKQTITNNASLRSRSPSAEAKAWRARIADAVRSQRVESDSVVYRGAALKPETIMQLRPGAVLTDAGVISTDESRERAQDYAESRARKRPGHLLTMFEIRAPARMNGYDADYGEFVFDSSMRVLSSRHVDGRVEVTAEFLAERS